MNVVGLLFRFPYVKALCRHHAITSCSFDTSVDCMSSSLLSKQNVNKRGKIWCGIHLRHYLFLVADSFLRASLSENSWLLRTDMSKNKYPSIFSRHMVTIVYIFSF